MVSGFFMSSHCLNKFINHNSETSHTSNITDVVFVFEKQYLGLAQCMDNAWSPVSVSIPTPLLCGCCVWQECQALYSGPVPYPIHHSLTPHCAFLWESLWQIRSFANASTILGDCKWSEMNYVIHRRARIIKIATEHTHTHTPFLHLVLPRTFQHLTNVTAQIMVSPITLTKRGNFVLRWCLCKYCI